MKKLHFTLLIIMAGLHFFPLQAKKISKKSKAKHVVIIGLDGWGSFSFDKADMPHVKKLMIDGSYSLSTRSVLPSSSAVNWASMFMGAGPELHGYTDWGSKTPDLPSRVITHYGMFPTIFGTLRDQASDAKIGYFYEWDGMKYLAEQKAMNESFHSTSPGDNHHEITQACTQYILKNRPTLTAIIFDQPDGKGHKIGFGSDDYYQKLSVLDQRIGEIIEAIHNAGIRNETIIMIVADHGDINTGHGGKTMNEMQVPLIFSGKGIRKNHQINASTMVYDIAATIGAIFNLNNPQVWTGRAITEIFSK